MAQDPNNPPFHRPTPPTITTEEGRAIFDYFDALTKSMQEALLEQPAIDLRTTHVAVTRPRPGMIVYVDGADWDPGEGEGLYVFGETSGDWDFIGPTAPPSPPDLSTYVAQSETLTVGRYLRVSQSSPPQVEDRTAAEARSDLSAQQTLSGLAIGSVTPTTSDLALLQDASNSNVLGVATIASILALGGGAVNLQVFTSSGTYTPTSGMRYCLVIVTGGGGNSGNANGTRAATGGGGAGATAIGVFDAATIGASQSVTVGAAASTSSFGSLMSATGGSSSANQASANSMGAGASGGTATGGDINIPGAAGSDAVGWENVDDACLRLGGDGAASFWGGGSEGRRLGIGDTAPANAVAATVYGAGAGGAATVDTGDASGALGAPGIVVVLEFT